MDGGLVSLPVITKEVTVRSVEIDDFPFFWAGYRAGAFEHIIPSDVTPDEFKNYLTGILTACGQGVTLVEGDRIIALIPIVRHLTYNEVIEQIWMPWVSPRTKYEATVTLWRYMREIRKTMGWTRANDLRFFKRICEHGVMKLVGQTDGLFPDEDAYLFASTKLEETSDG